MNRGELTEPVTRVCRQCGESFQTQRGNKRFCGDRCQKRHWNHTPFALREPSKNGMQSPLDRFLEVMTPCPWGCVNSEGLPIWGPKALLQAHRAFDHPELSS